MRNYESDLAVALDELLAAISDGEAAVDPEVVDRAEAASAAYRGQQALSTKMWGCDPHGQLVRETCLHTDQLEELYRKKIKDAPGERTVAGMIHGALKVSIATLKKQVATLNRMEIE